MKPYVFALLLSLLITTRASADVVTLSPTADASIFSANPNNSLGAAPGMFVGVDSSGSRLRSLLKFDVAAAIPAGAAVTAVQLELHLGQVAGGSGGGGDATPRTIELHRLLQPWAEATTGSTAPTIAGTGAGFAANPGDPTWTARVYDPTTPTLWSSPGGDSSSTPSASATVSQSLNAAYDWLSTPALVADVQAWLANPTTNNGWLLLNPDESTLKTFRAFYTHEATTASLRPTLQITFTPEPTLLSPALLATVVLTARSTRPRRRPRSS